MRILFTAGNGYLPQAHGGTQSSTDHLIKRCIARGDDARVLTTLIGSGRLAARLRITRKLTGCPVTHDKTPGYPVMRAWEPWDPKAVAYVAHTFRPDVVIVQTRMSVTTAQRFADLGIPTVFYLRNVEFAENDGDPSVVPGASFIANSSFTAEAYRNKYSIDCTVIPPTIDFDKYAYTSTGEFVSFINVAAKKGYDVAINVARECPDIPFLFVENWILHDDFFERITREMNALPNVTFMRKTSDMGSVYGRSKIVLAPSQWEEAWGRVASEAHCSGIPVVGSNRGGLPQAIGPGGIIVPYDAPTADWVNAIRKLWDDPTEYARMSSIAVQYAKRPQLDVDEQFKKFVGVLDAAVAKNASPLTAAA